MAKPTHAAFLRAVNLGSTRKASSADLRECFEQAGFEAVGTFRTSGNVVFGSASSGAATIRKEIEKALEEGLGFEVPTFVRTESQVKAIAAMKPFPAKAVAASKGKLQVELLERKPPAAATKKTVALASDDDQLALDGTELYWLPKGGTQDSPLDMKTIDQALGLNTLRTQGTIEQLAAKFF